MSTISIYVTSEDFHYLLNIDIYTVLVYWWEYERTLYLAPIFGTPISLLIWQWVFKKVGDIESGAAISA